MNFRPGKLSGRYYVTINSDNSVRDISSGLRKYGNRSCVTFIPPKRAHISESSSSSLEIVIESYYIHTSPSPVRLRPESNRSLMIYYVLLSSCAECIRNSSQMQFNQRSVLITISIFYELINRVPVSSISVLRGASVSCNASR